MKTNLDRYKAFQESTGEEVKGSVVPYLVVIDNHDLKGVSTERVGIGNTPSTEVSEESSTQLIRQIIESSTTQIMSTSFANDDFESEYASRGDVVDLPSQHRDFSADFVAENCPLVRESKSVSIS